VGNGIRLRRWEGIAGVLILECWYGWHRWVLEGGAMGAVKVVWSGLLVRVPTGQGKEEGQPPRADNNHHHDTQAAHIHGGIEHL